MMWMQTLERVRLITWAGGRLQYLRASRQCKVIAVDDGSRN